MGCFCSPNDRDARDRATVAARAAGRDWWLLTREHGISKRQGQRVIARRNALAEAAARPDLAGSVAAALTETDSIVAAIASEELGPRSSGKLGHLRRRLRGLEAAPICSCWHTSCAATSASSVKRQRFEDRTAWQSECDATRERCAAARRPRS